MVHNSLAWFSSPVAISPVIFYIPIALVFITSENDKFLTCAEFGEDGMDISIEDEIEYPDHVVYSEFPQFT